MGTCVGVVDEHRAWGPHRVRAGDDVVAIASNGVHSNGFSLVRKVLASTDTAPPPGLLAPTAIYARKLLDLAREVDVHAAAHVTGGGIADNLARVVPDGLGADVDLSTWQRPGVFEWIAEHGAISEDVMRATFNLGVGMFVLTPDGRRAAEVLGRLGLSAWVAGEVSGAGVVALS
jgi:phosphoribosylformylglycinamidine cyclo-ligase